MEKKKKKLHYYHLDFSVNVNGSSRVNNALLQLYSVDYEQLQLAGKIGGVCDIDQVYILNSIDGPTTGQCGKLSGYSSES